MDIIIEHYSVDNIEWFKEHEGMDAFKCDILYDGKKIGEFSEHYMNGPDIYSFDIDEIKKLRETATKFFKAYSKDEDLITDRFSSNEDFFIRFLRNLKEAIDLSQNGDGIEISTSYPFEYVIYENVKEEDGGFYKNDNDYKILFPVKPCKTNITVPKQKKEENYELV